jgi:hypothetical protein
MEDQILVATALLWRAQLHTDKMAQRQRNDVARHDYNDATKILRSLREQLESTS